MSRFVAGARPDAALGAGGADGDAVELAVVAAWRRVAEDLLAVQLLGDARAVASFNCVVFCTTSVRPPLSAVSSRSVCGVDARVDRLAFGRVDGDRVEEGVAAVQRRSHLAQRRGARRVGAVRDDRQRRALGASAAR